MTIRNRLKRLEENAPGGGVNMRRERRRWDALLAQMEPHVGDPAALKVVAAWLDRWFQAVPLDGLGGPFDGVRRLPGVALLFFRRLADPAIAAEVLRCGALDGNETTGPEAWLCGWLLGAARGESRIPPDVEPATLRAIVAAHDPGDGLYRIGVVCAGCGLRRESPDPCPHCRRADWTWSSRIREAARGWQVAAAVELDPDRPPAD